MIDIVKFLEVLVGLVPVIAFGAPLIAFIVDTAKRFGLKDGYAPLVSGLLNLMLYAIVFFLGEKHEGDIKTVVEALAALAPVILTLFVSLLVTARSHKALAGIGVGFSHTQPAG